MPERYVGLISGTSVDGIDAVLAKLGADTFEVLATHCHAYPDALQADLRLAMRHPDTVGADRFGELHVRVGAAFRDAAAALLAGAGVSAADVRAIGSHGQTLRHRPDAAHPFTLQIGDGATIATGTGIDTVADFRSSDVALGGEGAPLVPPFHAWLLGAREESRVALNIGGIANITVMSASGEVTGFDTGPGNTLLDAWSRLHRDLPYDEAGAWAGTGVVDEALVERALGDDWFDRRPPKSTGIEYFHLDWLNALGSSQLAPADVQASLAEISARSIANAIRHWAPGTRRVIACGGGVHNADLMRRLRHHLPDTALETTADHGLDPDWVEAAAFAWLAMRYVAGEPGNLPAVTGARRAAVLGALYRA